MLLALSLVACSLVFVQYSHLMRIVALLIRHHMRRNISTTSSWLCDDVLLLDRNRLGGSTVLGRPLDAQVTPVHVIVVSG